MPKTIGQLVLERAVQKLGESKLASRLQVSRHALRTMLKGLVAVPDSILLRAVDVVMDDATDFTPPGSQPPHGKKPTTSG